MSEPDTTYWFLMIIGELENCVRTGSTLILAAELPAPPATS